MFNFVLLLHNVVSSFLHYATFVMAVAMVNGAMHLRYPCRLS